MALMPINVYKKEGNKSEISFRLKAGEIFKAISGDIVIYRKGLGIIKKFIKNHRIKINKGKIVDIQCYVGEGDYIAKYKDNTILLSYDEIDFLQKPITEWWILVERDDGQNGWIFFEHENGIDDEIYHIQKIIGMDSCS
ncbi:MAG: hypothetical protein WHV67_09560 [Thermoanaerobaculia bacterium]